MLILLQVAKGNEKSITKIHKKFARLKHFSKLTPSGSSLFVGYFQFVRRQSSQLICCSLIISVK